MANLTFISLTGLVSLFLLSQLMGYVLKILDDRIYAPFHFLGGAFVAMLFYSLTSMALLSVILTLVIGVLWEIYEQVLWKFVLKKKKLQPQKQDTINDLVFDLLGALLTVFFLSS